MFSESQSDPRKEQHLKGKTSGEQQQQPDFPVLCLDATIVVYFRGQTACGNKGGPTIIIIKKQ